MSSSGFASDDQESRTEHAEPSATSPDELPDRSLLEEVLRETLSAHSAGEPILPGEMDALCSVARRYRGHDLVADPIAAELVESILRMRFPRMHASEQAWHAMSQQIAASLCEAPATQARLSDFWNQLNESVR